MKRRVMVYVAAAVLVVVGSIARAEWKPVAPGIAYQQFALDGPMVVSVARADRAKKNWTIDSCIGGGMLKNGRDTVSELAKRVDGSVNFRGQQYDVKVAVNGDYFSFKTDQAASGQIVSGWFVKRFGDYSGGSGFVWGSDRACFLGGNLRNGKRWQRVIFSDATEVPISNLNTARGPDELILYTPHYAEKTDTSNDGVEVLVRVPRPVGVVAKSGFVKGEIMARRKGTGFTPLPFDHVVLSGHGEAARVLLDHAKVGRAVRIQLSLKDYGVEGVSPADWTNAYASIGGHFYCVTKGSVPADRWERKGKPGAINRHPRTAVAFNDGYVYFIVADGRSERSVGMTITELGNFCVEHLSASYAIAQDGGGSSTMWIDGRVVNVPSDGKQRPVANGYVMALLTEPKKSTSFSTGAAVRVSKTARLRLGPGTNHGIAASVSIGQTGVVVEHPLNGIHAKKTYWWKCRFGQVEGWTAQDKLEARRPGGP